jgi:hypothetical protein
MSASIYAVVLTWALLSTAPALQSPAATSPQQPTPGGSVVSLIGCIERLPAAEAGRGTTGPLYKLIDVQPGSGTRMSLKAETQFLLVEAKSVTTPMDLGKFQNQRVEVTGTIVPAPPATVLPKPKPGERATEELPTFMLTSLKSVSTECK